MRIMKICKGGLGVLLVWGLLMLFTVPAQAANEVSQVQFNVAVIGDQFVQVPAEGLVVNWTRPTGIVTKYYLKFTESGEQLSDQDFNATLGNYDFEVDGALDMKPIPIPQSFFSNYDSGTVHYLHIKTLYLDEQLGQLLYSSDVVVPDPGVSSIKIDNVVPKGEIIPESATGNSTRVTIALSATEPVYYWLSNTADFPGWDALLGGPTQSTTFTWDIPADTQPGSQVTIYAWFQDMAGNPTMPTSFMKTATYTYLGPQAISPYTATIEVGSSQTFTVDPNTSYTWTLTPATGIASISGGNTGISATIVGVAPGTFTVTATALDNSQITSGEITVVQTIKLGDVTGDDKVTVSDVVKIRRASLNLSNTDPYIAAAADITGDGKITVSDVVKAIRLSLNLSI